MRSEGVRKGARKLLVFLAAAVIVLVAGKLLRELVSLWENYQRTEWHRYHAAPMHPSEQDEHVRQRFLDGVVMQDRYDVLFFYFLDGFRRHATPAGERINYSGFGSHRGFSISGVEGFARTAPLLAAWIYSGRNPEPVDETGRAADLVAMLRDGILAGTNRQGTAYWGDMAGREQLAVEAADIARVLWLTRAQIWDRFSATEKAQVASWLLQVNTASLSDNNWLLFPVVVNTALKSLGYSHGDSSALYERFRHLYYREAGWFFDMPHGVDFYNAWGISYDLFWIHMMDPDFDHDFLRQVLRESADTTALLISPRGIPVMGRSVCYRTAIPAPLLAAALASHSGQDVARARRATDVVWRYFMAADTLRDGALTQGYFQTDIRVLDNYTGPGSCHWGLRSLVLAYMNRADSPFWLGRDAALPVEAGSYRREFSRLGWVIEGDQASGRISVIIPANTLKTSVLQAPSRRQRLKELLRASPQRPENTEAKYLLHEYRSDRPFMLP